MHQYKHLFSLHSPKDWIQCLEDLYIEKVPQSLYCQTMMDIISNQTNRWNEHMQKHPSSLRQMYRLAWKTKYENSSPTPTDLLNTAFAHATPETRKKLEYILTDFCMIDEHTAVDIAKNVHVLKELHDHDNPLYAMIKYDKMREAWEFLKIQGNPLSESTWVELWSMKKDQNPLFEYNLIEHMHKCGMPIRIQDDILLSIALEQKNTHVYNVEYLISQGLQWTSHGCKAMFGLYQWSQQQMREQDAPRVATICNQVQQQYPDAWNYVQQAVEVGLPHFYAVQTIEALDISTPTS